MEHSLPIDKVLLLLAIILPTVLSGLGVLLSLEPSPGRHKWMWRLGLVVFGISISVITYWQQSRSAAQNENKQQQILQSSQAIVQTNQYLRERLEYLRGQLETISNVVGQVSAYQNSGVDKQVLAAVVNLAKTTAKSQDTRSALEKISNDQLRAKVLEFCRGLVAWSGKMKLSEDQLLEQERKEMMTVSPYPPYDQTKADAARNTYAQRIIQFNNDYTTEFRRDFLGTAIIYRDELIRRLGPQPQPSSGDPRQIQDRLALAAFDQGWISQLSVDAIAPYLEVLARKLP